MLRDRILLVPCILNFFFPFKNWRDLDFYEQKFQEKEKFHVRKVKCLLRATERKMSVWLMETSDRKYVCCLQATHLLLLRTNVKEKDKPEDRKEALLKIKCCDCQSTYIGETGRNLSTRLTERKRATRNQQQSHCWSPFTDETSNRLGLCDMYYVFSDYYQRLSLEIWFTENKRHWIVVNSYRHRTNDFIDGLKQNYNYERMTGQPTIWLT